MKRHAIYGYELLKNTPGILPSIALTALQHHERIGTIVMINPYDPLKVLLKTSTGIMDLRKEDRTNHRLMKKSPIIKNRALRHSSLPNRNRF
ncbi:hypothetical protein SRABI133_00558 [Peribacillus simplex]|uniref:Uncharacterized protein n=1 Tax=Peribacillus simplex TaxID=1478 RepID=A0A9W4PB80_9BACI|nr:hypothetical protein SRABI133_00558 [Peribacillus simplex]